MRATLALFRYEPDYDNLLSFYAQKGNDTWQTYVLVNGANYLTPEGAAWHNA